MTSPVDTSVKFFHSKMLGAPVLRGQAGSLIAILDACLVNGWGIQTAASCVVAGGVCTMTFPLDHAALVDAVILVDGASIAALNGEQKVTAVVPNVVKFATEASNGTATGTITAKMAPMGFNKPFSGTNLAVYKSAHVQANGQYLRINDTGTTMARAQGYETMTAISTGTGLFPSSAQVSGGSYWEKSDGANTIPIDWTVYGDGRFFAFFPSAYQGNFVGAEAYVSYSFMAFGDLASLSPAADPFSTFITGVPNANVQPDSGRYYMRDAFYDGLRFMARDISGVGGSVGTSLFDLSWSSSTDAYDRVTGQIGFSKLGMATTGSGNARAILPGISSGRSIYMEAVLAQHTVFKAGTPERSYLALLTSNAKQNTTALFLTALDITGPIR